MSSRGSYPVSANFGTNVSLHRGWPKVKDSTINIIITIVVIMGIAIIFATPAVPIISLSTLAPTLNLYPLGKVMCEVEGKSVNVVAVTDGGKEVVTAEVRPNDGTYFKVVSVADTEKIVCVDPR